MTLYLDLMSLQTAPGNPFLGVLPILLIFAIFYFLLFMPMQRQKKQQQKMLAELQNGSVVVTTGGIIGARVKPDNVKLQIARSAVAGLVTSEEKK
jgi:preprotein translocase subunit YajC